MTTLPVPTLRIPVSALRLGGHPSPWSQLTPLLRDWFSAAEGPVLTQLITQLTTELHEQAKSMSNQDVSAVIQLITELDERREEAELAANPARRAGIERVGERFARKAQSGFSPHPLA